MAEGLAGVELIEGVKDRIGLITEGAAADRLELKVQVIQEEMHTDGSTQGLGAHLRSGTQDQNRAVQCAPLLHLIRNRA